MADSLLGDPSAMGGLLGSDPTTLGLSLMAAAGPSPYRQPIGSVVGKGALMARQAQTQKMQNDAMAMDLAMRQYQLHNMQSTYPMLNQWLMQHMGGGTQMPSPQLASDPQSQSIPSAVAGASTQGGSPAAAPQGAPQMPQGNPMAMPGGGGGPQGDGMDALNMGAIMSLNGMPGGQAVQEVGKAQLQYDPQLAQRMEAAKSKVNLDLYNYRQALAVGDQAAARMHYQAALTDSKLLNISERNGNITAFTGGVGADGLPNFTNVNPDKGIKFTNTGAALIPGYAGAQGAVAAAEAQGRATGETVEVTDGQGNKYIIPKSAALAGTAGSPATATAPATAPGTPFKAALGPAVEGLQKGQGEQAVKQNEEYQDKAEAGNQMLAQISELRNAANDFSPGQFANSRARFLNYLNSAGLISPEQQRALGAAQVGQKIAIQLQAAATKQLGSREAAQIFEKMGKSLPNLELSQNGFDQVTSYMAGMSRYDLARAQVAQSRFNQQDVNGVNNVRNDFIQNTNPAYFIIASAPPAAQKQMLESMGAKKAQFLKDWQDAANKGWAPRPGSYNGGS